ncbi:Ehmt1 [Symbiodinium natans]|uniref:Ehmt1 protein n=1 Tax=Symbiodinium natans TaxID=878477 RepID=A0A812MQ07_9DINO|nr:Ehmt1 [Symbiodinium natans]
MGTVLVCMMGASVLMPELCPTCMVSAKACEQLESEFPNYQSLSLADLFKESKEDDIQHLMSGPEPAVVDVGLVQSLRLQAAVRCLFSKGPAGPALCDAAYCARRGCLREQNEEVGYTMLGECPDV